MSNKICENNIPDIVNNYMNKGWISISKSYLDIAKEKSFTSINDKLLQFLGSLRIYYVDLVFNCYNKNNSCEYISFGSNELTSDYDLTIIGKDAPELTWKIFKFFLDKHNNTLPYVFDTNLYCNGYVSNKDLVNSKYIQKVDDKISIIRPQTKEEYKISLNFALLKLLDKNILDSKYLQESKKIKNELDTIFKNTKISGVTKYNKYIQDETKKYYLASQYCKKVFKVLYFDKINNSHSERSLQEINFNYSSIIENLCKSCYFSIESYYTPCTTSVIILELQAGKKCFLTKKDYIISAIENLGDYYIHTKDNNLQTLMKTSKYLYRIYYSLYKATDKNEYNNLFEQYKNFIIPLRGKKIDKLSDEVKKILNNINIDSIIKEIESQINKI